MSTTQPQAQRVPARKPRKYPVVELFGPTVQGEGPAQGERCWFVRLGGCDYRCTWCDTMYAVQPALVREAPRLTATEVMQALYDLGMPDGALVILSGGNPALHQCDDLLDAMAKRSVRVHVETQGTLWRDWLNRCELVVVSPKPPSAWDQVHSPSPPDTNPPVAPSNAWQGAGAARVFCARLEVPWALKFVAFDEADLLFAVDARKLILGAAPLGYHQASYLSAGTSQLHLTKEAMVKAVLVRYRWLCTQHVEWPELGDFRVGLQAHVLVWPGELGR